MFERLSDKLDAAFKKLKGRGKLTDKNIDEGLKEIRMVLLEADVHYRVAKRFIADVKKRALGQEVLDSGALSFGRSLYGTEGAEEEMQSRLFGTEVQVRDRGVIRLPAGALVYFVKSRQPFDVNSFELAKSELRQQLRQDRQRSLQSSFLDGMTRELDFKEGDIRTDLIQRLDG